MAVEPVAVVIDRLWLWRAVLLFNIYVMGLGDVIMRKYFPVQFYICKVLNFLVIANEMNVGS